MLLGYKVTIDIKASEKCFPDYNMIDSGINSLFRNVCLIGEKNDVKIRHLKTPCEKNDIL